jgi:cytochrome c peroxidase
VSQFSSKYDAVVAGNATFTSQEQAGFNLFMGKGKCNKCHTVNPRGKQALFTDFTYDNLGFPKNPENPFYSNTAFNPLGAAWIDYGLGGFLNSRPDYVSLAHENFGKHKVPTLRNVDKWESGALGDKVKAYGHNGYFKSLKGIVHFYNTRDVLPVCNGDITEAQALVAKCWPLPELALNMNTKELGNLKLSDAEENALVEFMKTLSDGYSMP